MGIGGGFMRKIWFCLLLVCIMAMPGEIFGINIGANSIYESKDIQDIPQRLREIREREISMIRNLRTVFEEATRNTAPAALKAVDRCISVLDEDAMTINNFMRLVRESPLPDRYLLSAIADCIRSNAQFRNDAAAMLRKLRSL